MANSCGDSIVHHALQELIIEVKRYAAAHLNETDETRENAVANIRRWIEESGNLPAQIGKNDHGLTRLVLPLREPDNQGRLVIIMHCTRHDPRRHEISNIFKIAMAVFEVAMKYYSAASVYGCALFMNVANPTIRHAGQMRPQIIKNIVHAWQSCYPIRVQSINMINAPEYVEIVLKIFRYFMTEKMQNRLHVYTQKMMQNYFKDIPANILPVEYGGTNGTLLELTEYWKKLVEENRDWIMENEND
ncbi:retinol-binding protein pinta isoform X2 [Solenopsis invicta]|uniref:retinol-binding protein pinta isoform X2 n=1 Tax=Solenopsis invicta TaxID=13686 RepID=UPI00193DF2F7|nr:retinol-binding protein pinta isoform X2 [Solenopsis invicta]